MCVRLRGTHTPRPEFIEKYPLGFLNYYVEAKHG